MTIVDHRVGHAELGRGRPQRRWCSLLDRHESSTQFADPAWHVGVVVASVYGLPGVLMLRNPDEVAVQAFVSPDRGGAGTAAPVVG